MKTLKQWLDWLYTVHPDAIDLGLERVGAVWQRLGARRPAPCVVTVGGTNGKGSTVALLEAMLHAAGHRVGCYTSPHLLRYNERIRLGGADVADAALVAVFERIETLRGATPLTWFEYGTLAALELMADATLDVAVLEVGLGGRLDAVNIVDADAAIVTSVGIDHVEYLGPDRDAIGREKAGIFRPHRPAIVGDPEPPAALLDAARRLDADVWRYGLDFAIQWRDAAPLWWCRSAAAGTARPSLALQPRHLGAPGREYNLASALACLHALRGRLGWHPRAYADAALAVRPAARVQRIPGPPEIIIDVAHNPHAVAQLARWLQCNPVQGRTLALFGAMRDKDVAGMAAVLGPAIAHWHVCPLPQAGVRGLESGAVAARIREGCAGARSSEHASVADALAAARGGAASHDRILVFGSFHLAGAVLAALT